MDLELSPSAKHFVFGHGSTIHEQSCRATKTFPLASLGLSSPRQGVLKRQTASTWAAMSAPT